MNKHFPKNVGDMFIVLVMETKICVTEFCACNANINV